MHSLTPPFVLQYSTYTLKQFYKHYHSESQTHNTSLYKVPTLARPFLFCDVRKRNFGYRPLVCKNCTRGACLSGVCTVKEEGRL